MCADAPAAARASVSISSADWIRMSAETPSPRRDDPIAEAFDHRPQHVVHPGIAGRQRADRLAFRWLGRLAMSGEQPMHSSISTWLRRPGRRRPPRPARARAGCRARGHECRSLRRSRRPARATPSVRRRMRSLPSSGGSAQPASGRMRSPTATRSLPALKRTASTDTSSIRSTSGTGTARQAPSRVRKSNIVVSRDLVRFRIRGVQGEADLGLLRADAGRIWPCLTDRAQGSVEPSSAKVVPA